MRLCFLVSSVNHVCKYILLFKTYVPIGVLYFYEFAKFGGLAHPSCGLLGACGGLPGEPVFPGASPGVPPHCDRYLLPPGPHTHLGPQLQVPFSFTATGTGRVCVCAYMYVHVCAWV